MESKIVNRLQSLQINASRESIQTVAKWFLFNRKHASTLSSTLLSEMCSRSKTNSRLVLHFMILDEMLTGDMNVPTKWKRNQELRDSIGLQVLQPFFENDNKIVALTADEEDKLNGLFHKWQHASSYPFSNKDLLNQLESLFQDWKSKPIVTAALHANADTSARTSTSDSIPVTEQQQQQQQQQDDEEVSKEAQQQDKSEMIDEKYDVEPMKIDTTTAATNTTVIPPNAKSAEAGETDAAAAAAAAAAAVNTVTKQADTNTNDNNETVQSVNETDTKHAGESTSNTTEGHADNQNNDDKTSPTPTTSIPPTPPPPSPSQTTTTTTTTTTKASKERDSSPILFDKNAPIIKVQAQDFLEPCKSIATLQIAREIRNDTAARLWNALQTIPTEVETYVKTLYDKKRKKDETNDKEDNEDKEEEEEDPEQQFLQQELPPLSEEVLDIDIQEALNEIQQFRNVLQRQRQARQTCIDLLMQSQCQFGSIDAAKAFDDIHEKLHLVKKRKLLLSDAMELEGLDFVEEEERAVGDGDGVSGTGGTSGRAGVGGSGDKDDEVLEPLTWYTESAARASVTK